MMSVLLPARRAKARGGAPARPVAREGEVREAEGGQA